MRGTSSPDDKLAGDLGNEIEGIESAVTGQIFLKQKIGVGKFGTFSTASLKTRSHPFRAYVGFHRLRT